MTIEKMFNDFRIHCEKIAMRNEENVIVFVNGTKQKQTKFNILIEKYEKDSKLDFSLGYNPTRELEEKAYKVMKKSMESYNKK